jgi:hypothetical protein
MEDFYSDEYTHDSHIPRIEIGSIETMADIELELATHHDEFYRRIITYMIETVENKIPVGEPLAILVDEEGVEYDMELPPDGYMKSLNKCMEYFTDIEEYETCSLIKDIIDIVQNGLH